MHNGSGHLNSAVDAPFSPKPAPPRLLVELEPGHRVFFQNLFDTLRLRRAPQVEISSPPAAFWADVFVPSRLPWWQLSESFLVHVLVLSGIWGVSRALALRPHITPRVAFNKADVIYYSPSEYLQPIDTGNTSSAPARRGEPEFARQPIISVPPEADNRSQTIITAPNIKLERDVPLPNIVAWDHPVPAPPLPDDDLRAIPNVQESIVAPPPEVSGASTRRLDASQAAVVAPAPSVSSAAMRSVDLPQGAIIAPPPTVQRDIRTIGDINVARTQVIAPAPVLPVREQRALAAIASLAGQQARIVAPPPSLQGNSRVGAIGRGLPAVAGGAQVVAPAPSMRGFSEGLRGTSMGSAQAAVVPPAPTLSGHAASSSGRQLIALSLHPAVGPPPAEVAGNRRGTFAATPEGHAGAAGTPDHARGAHVLGEGGHGNGNGGSSSGQNIGLPSGIHVGSAPPNAPGAQVSAPGASGSGSSGSSSQPNQNLLAENRPLRVTVAPKRAMESSNAPSEEERRVFGDRKSYSMVLNMPNLNSGGGSWVIHFAELKDSAAAARGDLIAPEPTKKVDPGYPMELMRENVKGTVMLYAVIHSDGTVSDVRVLSSPDGRLDDFARAALAGWHFRPAMKNGIPVPLEAVVKIPFRPARAF